MAGPPDRAFAHMRISEERRTPSPFPMHKPDLRVDLSSLNVPSPPPQHVANVIPINTPVARAHMSRPSPQMTQEPPSVPSAVSPRLSPRERQEKADKNNKFTFHFPPPIMNPFGGSSVGTPTQYQLDSALPAKGEQTVIFFPMVNPPPTPPQPHYGSPASPQLSPRGPRATKPPEGGGRARALTEGPPVSPRGSSSSSQNSSNPTSPRNRRANSLSPQKTANPPYPVFKMRVLAGKLEDVSKPRVGKQRRGAISPHPSTESLPESDPALDLPFPVPAGFFQICRPDSHPDLAPAVAEEPPLNFLDEDFLRGSATESLMPIGPIEPLPLPPMALHHVVHAPQPMETTEWPPVPGSVQWQYGYPPAAADTTQHQPSAPHLGHVDDFWPPT